MVDEAAIVISPNQVRELYELMEELQGLFHQSMNYEDTATVKAFADKHYLTIKKAYYETLWDLLPLEDKEAIELS